MKKLLLIILAVTVGYNSFSNDYHTGKIPESLKKNANAVVRNEVTRFEINSLKETTTRIQYVITILNSAADYLGKFSEHYNSYTDIVSFEGILYDANGKVIKKVKKKDLSDVSAVQESNLMDDLRMKSFDFYHRAYPYTVEYTYEIKKKMTFFFPSWAPVPAEKVSSEYSKIEFVAPENYQFRYKAFNYEHAPEITAEKNKKVSSWQVKNQEALVRKPHSPLFHELVPYVIFAPTDFQINDYTGNMASWNDFGKFIYSLNQGRDVLPVDVQQKVSELLNGVSDTHEKIKRLYHFMQQSTRYISIQLGIGGWQPHTAEFVAKNGYGDCKALTNYMYSLLKFAGIESFYVLIRSGRGANYLTEDFPSNQFNHAILAVPAQTDTVWLECTDQTLPAGYLSGFTENRPALLIKEDGSKLVRTPVYGMNENLQVRNIEGKINQNGALELTASSRYTGVQQDDIHSMINSLTSEKVKEVLSERFSLATYDVNNFKYKAEESAVPEINEDLDITVYNFATITGKRMFVVPNIMTRSGNKYNKDDERKEDFLLGFEYRDIDTVKIEIPEGYEVEYKPADINLSTGFTNYASSIKIDGNYIYYYRLIEITAGRYPGSKYKEYTDFSEAVYKADRERVVLRKTD